MCFGKKSPFDSQYICSDICLRTLVNTINPQISPQWACFKFRRKSAQLFKEGTLFSGGAFHAVFNFYQIVVIYCMISIFSLCMCQPLGNLRRILSILKNYAISHFRVRSSLYFKASLSAKSLKWKWVFTHMESRNNYHHESFALRLALK